VSPEAYNVLVLSEASSYEEALQLYCKAEELGPQVCYMLVGFCVMSGVCSAGLAAREASSYEEALYCKAEELYCKAEELGPQVCNTGILVLDLPGES
jgi:hypothetical protein